MDRLAEVPEHSLLKVRSTPLSGDFLDLLSLLGRGIARRCLHSRLLEADLKTQSGGAEEESEKEGPWKTS